jgi:lysozyme family protein
MENDIKNSVKRHRVYNNYNFSFFEKAVYKLLQIEGVYPDNAVDLGGKTKFGVTEKTARDYGYQGRMSEMPFYTAKEIYKKCYWNKIQGEELAKHNKVLAFNVLECAVHCGVSTASVWLQRAVNFFAQEEIKEDGVIGPITLKALSATRKQNAVFVSTIVNIYQGVHYLKICQAKPLQKTFLKGWLKRINFN